MSKDWDDIYEAIRKLQDETETRPTAAMFGQILTLILRITQRIEFLRNLDAIGPRPSPADRLRESQANLLNLNISTLETAIGLRLQQSETRVLKRLDAIERHVEAKPEADAAFDQICDRIIAHIDAVIAHIEKRPPQPPRGFDP